MTSHFVFRIQIGAPRGNDTKLYVGVIEPGVVFRCPIAESCSVIKFDTSGKLGNELMIPVALFFWEMLYLLQKIHQSV